MLAGQEIRHQKLQIDRNIRYYWRRARRSTLHICGVGSLVGLALLIQVGSWMIYGPKLHTSAETCVGKSINTPIEWLHITKTGTSFGKYLLAVLCPGEEHFLDKDGVKWNRVSTECQRKFKVRRFSRPEWPIGDHFSLENVSHSDLSSIFTFIRSPITRIPSGFHHITEYKRLTESPKRICEFVATLPGEKHSLSLGHQVKIIMGYPIGQIPGGPIDTDPPNAVEVKQACFRLSRFGFVGLTDFWETSICIFQSMYCIRSEDKYWIRKGKGQQDKTSRADCSDIWDKELFTCGLVLLLRNLKKHPHCEGIFLREIAKIV